jgi:glucans biosynthesis protein
MHGGATGSGAPQGNANARKHGLFAKIAIEERRQVQALIDQASKLLRELK